MVRLTGMFFEEAFGLKANDGPLERRFSSGDRKMVMFENENKSRFQNRSHWPEPLQPPQPKD